MLINNLYFIDYVVLMILMAQATLLYSYIAFTFMPQLLEVFQAIARLQERLWQFAISEMVVVKVWRVHFGDVKSNVVVG